MRRRCGNMNCLPHYDSLLRGGTSMEVDMLLGVPSVLVFWSGCNAVGATMNAHRSTHVSPAGRNGLQLRATQTRPTSTVSLGDFDYRTKLEQDVYEPDRVSGLDRAKMHQSSVGQEQEGCNSRAIRVECLKFGVEILESRPISRGY